jgi:predicted lipoprotein with Yx(FWY)xxD motif
MKRSIMILAALALVIGACGGDGAGDTTVATTPDTTSAPAETTPETTTPTTATETTMTETTVTETTSGESSGGAAMTLTTADSDLGTILVDDGGKTLYLFVPDAQGASTCYDDCEANWPPFAGEVSAGEGVDESLLGTTERTDGTVQATYNGWPLYYFAADAAAGETNGQGISDVWWVVDAEGNAIEG